MTLASRSFIDSTHVKPTLILSYGMRKDLSSFLLLLTSSWQNVHHFAAMSLKLGCVALAFRLASLCL